MTDDSEFKIDDESFEIGMSLGAYKRETSAIKAFEMGEIERWVEYHRPKNLDGWAVWNAQHHGEDIPGRWEPEGWSQDEAR